MANEEQFEYWNETAGPKWVAARELLDVSLRPFTDDLVHSARIESGHSILDVGCGTGETTVELCRIVAPGGSVLGVDLSSVMLDAAGVRAAQAGVAPRFRQADAQVASFEGEGFDRIVSRFGVMFFEDPIAAFGNLRSAARSGGELAFLCWQAPAANSWISLPMSVARQFVELPKAEEGAPGPFALADPSRVRGILEAAGWSDIGIESRQGSMVFGDGSVAVALEFLQKIGPLSRLLAEIDSEQERASLLEALNAAFEERSRGSDHGRVELGAATWLVSARA